MSNRIKAEQIVSDEIANGEYGEEHREKMVSAITRWLDELEEARVGNCGPALCFKCLATIEDVAKFQSNQGMCDECVENEMMDDDPTFVPFKRPECEGRTVFDLD